MIPSTTSFQPHSTTEIQWWPIERLVPYARNPRKNDEAVERMMASIREFGFKIPILVRSTGEVVDGHLRLKAAQRLGLTEVPTLSCDEWTEAQVRAFRLLVNRSASWAEWDEELLALEIQDLKAMDFDIDLTGFDPVQIDEYLFQGVAADSAENDIPAPVDHVISRPGDLWLMAGHRLFCGDATLPEAVHRLVDETKPVLMTTDPPYGVEYDPQWRERAGLGRLRQTGMVRNDDRADWSAAYQLFPGDVAYIWHAALHAAEVAAGLERIGFKIRAQIIWAKQHFALSRGDYHWGHEPAWYAVREGKSSNWSGDRTQSTVWQVANLNPFGGSEEEPATGHGTQKPVELMRRPILNHTRRGEVVYDPFLGAGSTLIAAESVDRICHGLEIDPKYVDIIVKRWQQYTGCQAFLEGDGRSFDELAAERATKEEF